MPPAVRGDLPYDGADMTAFSSSSVRGHPLRVELHLHLEGCLSAARARQLWKQRPEVGPPPRGGLTAEGWAFEGLDQFLHLFGWAVRLLDGPAAYLQLLDDTMDRLEEQGVVYAELFVSFGVMRWLHRDPRPVVEALAHRAQERAAKGGVDLRFVADGVRQFGVDAAHQVVEDAIELRSHRVVGFGLGGDETAMEAATFVPVFRRAREAGLGLSLHAGEGDRPEAVAQALELGVARIGHGIAAATDHALLARLAQAEVTVEVCPTSNERTGIWSKDRGTHPVRAMADQGVRVCLGSDDPAFFGAWLQDEWERCAAEGVSREELEEWNENAARAAFLSEEERSRLLRKVRGEENQG